MNGKWVLAGVAVAAGVLPGVAQPPAAAPNTLRRADPPTAPRTGLFVAPEWRNGRAAKPCTLPGVPDYAYAPAGTARPTSALLSLVRVPAARLPGAEPLPPGVPPPQVYQMVVAKMQVDHCFLSRVAVALHPDGLYQVSFRADQNPLPGPGSPVEVAAVDARLTLQTSQLRRNLFVLRVRGYGNYPAAATDDGVPGLSRPVLWEQPLEPFWVQRGEPYSGYIPGQSEAVRRAFAYIDRVEVEFTYR